MNFIKRNYKKIILILAFAINILFSLFVARNLLKKNELDYVLIIPGVLQLADITMSTIGLVKVCRNRYKKFLFYIYSFILSILGIVTGSAFAFSNAGYITLLIFKMVFCFAAMIYYFIISSSLEKAEENDRVNHSFDDWATLVFDCIINIALLTLFITPYYTNDTGDILLITPLFESATDLVQSIASLSFLVLWIISFINLSNVIAIFACGRSEFAKKSKQNVMLALGITFAFTGSGYVIALVYSLAIKVMTVSSALLPVIVIGLLSIIHSIFVARSGYVGEEEKTSERMKLQRVVIMIFVTLITISTFAALLVDIVDVNFLNTSGATVYHININGKNLMENYTTLEKGFKLLAFTLVVFMLSSLGLYIATFISFASRSKYYKPLALIVVVINFVFVFVFAVFGAYYKIVNEIDKVTLQSIITSYGYGAFTNMLNMDTKITSQSLILLVIDFVLCIVLFIVKPFTKYDLEDAGVFRIKNLGNEGDNNSSSSNNANSNNTNNEEEKEEEEKPVEVVNKLNDFDACPAFSEIDSYKVDFDNHLIEVKEHTFEEPSLPNLVKFIVDYARESRLHLSYSFEDIATFIAGLGTTRLQILQGMSGTGKTSLPKIFMEAILGKCEIVEVESSWKDKNELLGYYNEFSKVYTPKKFTQALYRAALNPEIITFIVLDEMNLSRIEYYFSDFLSLMENEEDKREIKLLNVKLYNTYDNEKHSYLGLSNDHTIKIPRNVWFIGTANRDESTFEISDKVYDRAYTMNFNKRAPKVKNFMEAIPQAYVSYETFRALTNKAIEEFSFDLDDYEIIGAMEKLLQPYNISFGNRVAKQIEEFVKIYCSCFNNPNDLVDEALEKVLLTKVVSKLEFKSIEDKEGLVREFEKLKLYKCSEFISRLNEDF